MPIVLKSGSLNLLELSGPVQACNGIALPLPLCIRKTGRLLGYTVATQNAESVCYLLVAAIKILSLISGRILKRGPLKLLSFQYMLLLYHR